MSGFLEICAPACGYLRESLRANLGYEAISVKMPRSLWADEQPGGWRGVDAGKLEGTESVGSGFELGLCPLTSCVATLSLSSPPANEDNSTHLLDFF